jgi:hypothetical protein
MPTEYVWKISQLEREILDGFVYTAHYLIDAKSDSYTAGAYGSISFERPENLIPYSDLSETEVLNWVLQALGEEKVTSVLEALQAQLDEQRNPTKATGLPWVSA